MLPFLKRERQVGGVASTVHRKPDYEQSEEHEGLSACAKELIDGIQAGDHKKVASALKDAFQILESMPHEEGPHEESEESESE